MSSGLTTTSLPPPLPHPLTKTHSILTTMIHTKKSLLLTFSEIIFRDIFQYFLSEKLVVLKLEMCLYIISKSHLKLSLKKNSRGTPPDKERSTNVSSPSTCKNQYCREPQSSHHPQELLLTQFSLLGTKVA